MERGKRLLNLKDLLTVFPPSFKRVFENGPILRPLFLCRIVPNSAVFCQNLAEYGIKLTFFATGLLDRARTCRSGPIPTSAAHKSAGRPKASPERPARICVQAVTGFHQRVAVWLQIW